MNITFLIGNGFDRNLGLDTQYSDFTKHYKSLKPASENIRKFQEHIDDDKELWFDAEIAIGKYTGHFAEGEAEAYSECHTDFCVQLSEYLKEQEKRINYEKSSDAINEAFAKINSVIQSFPTQERERLNSIYHNRRGESIHFNFICFNYTRTLDECISIAKKNPSTVGKHNVGNQVFNHSIDQVCHVHGTVDKEMVFGVNDESQIAKLEIFNCENGDIYKSAIIKIQTNESYLENTDTKAKEIIESSNLIYVFGMSIGDTDKLWWDRICTWLSASSDRHLILHKYSMPEKSVVHIGYRIAERAARKDFTRHSAKLNDAQKESIEGRIHITSENIFSAINNIATKEVADAKTKSTESRILTFEEYVDLSTKASQFAPEVELVTKALEKAPVAAIK